MLKKYSSRIISTHASSQVNINIAYFSEASSKAVAICKAKKISYQEAVRNAFQKVVIVRLSDGRVYVEVNTTIEETLHFDEDIDTTKLIKVKLKVWLCIQGLLRQRPQ